MTVSVTVGGTTLSATSADQSGTARWSVSVPAAASYITGTSVAVTVTASKTGYTAPNAVTRMLTVDLVAPTAPSYTAPGSLTVGVAMTAISPMGGSGIDSYAATDLPSGLAIVVSTGEISGTPDAASSNTVTATVTVSDAAGNEETVDIAFPAVARGTQTLTGFAYSADSVTFGTAAPTVTAPSGARTTLTPTADGAVTVDVAVGAAMDAAGNASAAAAQATSTYTAPLTDTTAPTVTSIARRTPASSPTNANSLTWRVTFSESVASVDLADFAVSGTTATLAFTVVTGATPANSQYDVTASGGNLATLDGTVTLSFAAVQDIMDTGDNALESTTPTERNDNTYEVDNTAPTLSGRDNGALELGFEARRREGANDDAPPEHEVGLRLEARW